MTGPAILIVGGGIAGSAAAILLARAGRTVTLIEREPAAHDKVCGEFISVEAVASLHALGLDVAAHGAHPIGEVRLIHRRQIASGALPFTAMSLSRRVLDEALLALASAAGVTILRGQAVTSLQRCDTVWAATLSDGTRLTAPDVFLATGKHDLRGWTRRRTDTDDYIGLKMRYHTTGTPARTVGATELILFPGGYAGWQPTEADTANLCLVVGKAAFAAHGKSWDALTRSVARDTPRLAEALATATPFWAKPLAIFGLPYGYVFTPSARDQPGLYRIGDQMGVIPSLSGDGMAIALHSAEWAVDACLTRDAQSYHHDAHRRLSHQIDRAVWIGRAMSSSLGRRALVAACRRFPKLLSYGARMTRVTASH